MLLVLGVALLVVLSAAVFLPSKLDCKLTYNPPITYTFSVVDRITNAETVLYTTYYEGQLAVNPFVKPTVTVFPCVKNEPASLWSRIFKR